MKLLAIIPARGGSKGIPGKNMVDFAGKPLIAWTIEAAKLLPQLSIMVSTDDERIAQIADNYAVGTSYRRPVELASDTATTLDTILHALNWHLNQGQLFDAVLLLQPTSPLRTAQHIQEAITQWEQHPEKPLVSVCEPSHPPHLIFQSEGGEFWKRLAPLPQTGRRQDTLHKYVQLNGAIYIQSVQRLQAGFALFEENNTNFYHMSYESSIDIDTPLDLMIAQLLLNNSMSAIEK